MVTKIIIISLLVASCLAQRPSYAKRPVGFPTVIPPTEDGLGNRFGEESTERLPIEAGGDRDLVNRISKLPVDKQPFWYINWKALEDLRKNPPTYDQKPNVFIDPVPSNSNQSN